ncbi:MAG: M28 family peptidase [Rhizobiales bacterium]|nr:M28 family peptidase [Hyphomicrobiales bacterium]
MHLNSYPCNNAPNNTDFTVFRKLGSTGLNFAFSDAPNYYHSKNDTIEYLNKVSL